MLETLTEHQTSKEMKTGAAYAARSTAAFIAGQILVACVQPMYEPFALITARKTREQEVRCL